MTLKRHFDQAGEDRAVRQLVSTLLDKIGSGAAIGEATDYQAFRSEIESIRERLGPETKPEMLLLHTGFAAQALETYNRGVNRFHRQQARMMQNIVNTMIEALIAIGGEKSPAAPRLRQISGEMERAGTAGDLETLKLHLGECLESIREQIARRKTDTDNLIQALRQEIQRGPASSSSPQRAARDTTARIPAKDAAVSAMYQSVAPGKHRYVVVMVVNRIQPINARFGHEAGDRILNKFAQYAAQQLSPSDQLFRWTGPAFVALLDRSETLDEIRVQLKRTMEARLEETFMVEGRSVLIPVSAAWSAFQLVTTVTEVERQIQIFIASQGSQDYA